jgi:hypothetical protein
LKRKYRKPPPNIRTRKRVDVPMQRGIAPVNAGVRKKGGAAFAAPARVRGAEELERKARFPAAEQPEMRPIYEDESGYPGISAPKT